MKKLLLSVIGCAAMTANAATIDFEGLTTPANPSVTIPNGYETFTWSNFFALDADAVSGDSGYKNGVTSGDEVGFNGSGAPASMSRLAGFDLLGFNVTAAQRNNLELTIQGFQHGTLLYSQTLTLNAFAPLPYSVNFAGVTSVRFSTLGGDPTFGTGFQFAIDDIAWQESSLPIPPAPVPEGGPGVFGLLVLGGMLFAYRPRS